jgi:site-specific DNA-methyltransferase (adenine-specific)
VPKKTPAKSKPLYRRKPPKATSPKSSDHSLQSDTRPSTVDPELATVNFHHPHFLAPSHFTLREDGTIQNTGVAQASGLSSFGVSPNETSEAQAGGHSQESPGGTPVPPSLIFTSDSPFLRLYHGNCLELLDAIAAKYPEGRFDAIFADPPYFLSNGGITCHAGRMVKVDKGDWDISRGPELNHEFNLEWLRRCQRVLKPNGTLWVSGTHHVIFSIGYALQQLGYKILNDIAWEKPNPPPNLSCRYFTHSTETILWAAKNEKSKHVFNYAEMRKVSGKQMKTVWRGVEDTEAGSSKLEAEEFPNSQLPTFNSQKSPTANCQLPASASEKNPVLESIWTISAPGNDEKTFGKHPTQKPVALVERCLRASTREGDLVLDPFLGNGTTAVACVCLNRQCVGIELDALNVHIAERRVKAEIILIWLRHFRVRIEVSVFAQIDLDLLSDSINGSRRMADVPQIETERIFHECKFVFLSCAQVERGAVVHTTVDMSLQEAWAKTPNGNPQP